MLIDCDLISYYSVEELLPYPQYQSGEKAGENPIYKYSAPSKTHPVLTLEQDILFDDGRGIKQGFYQVLLNDDFDFLILVESGDIKAKIPVISIGQRKEMPLVRQKVERQFRKPREGTQYKPPQPLKNNKGIDSEDFIYLNASMHFDKDNDSYVLIYERGNTKAVGVIKK